MSAEGAFPKGTLLNAVVSSSHCASHVMFGQMYVMFGQMYVGRQLMVLNLEYSLAQLPQIFCL